jgi:hypothetical protein
MAPFNPLLSFGQDYHVTNTIKSQVHNQQRSRIWQGQEATCQNTRGLPGGYLLQSSHMFFPPS